MACLNYFKQNLYTGSKSVYKRIGGDIEEEKVRTGKDAERIGIFKLFLTKFIHGLKIRPKSDQNPTKIRPKSGPHFTSQLAPQELNLHRPPVQGESFHHVLPQTLKTSFACLNIDIDFSMPPSIYKHTIECYLSTSTTYFVFRM